MDISEVTYRKFSRFISEIAGIELGENREKMLVNRISARLTKLHIESFEDYYEYVCANRDGHERQALIDSVTTHYTSFFRDEGQFAHVREELLQLLANGQRKIRIWSAACSSGEEPYSLAIVAIEAAALSGIAFPDVRILATDISNKILRDAHSGWFPVSSLKKLSVMHRTFFEPLPRKCEITGEPMLRANKQLRDLIIFRQVNLCDQPVPVPTGIDIIFCRNVLLYFNARMQEQILGSVTSKLKPNGLLYVGASERVRGFLPAMESERACVFRKLEAGNKPTLTAELCTTHAN